MKKLGLARAVCSLVLGILVLLQLPLPAVAQGEVTGSFTVELVISNVSASDIGSYGATISWDTSDNATSQVFYDTQSHDSTAGYAYHSVADPALLTEHSVLLTGLSPSTTYHYRAKSVATVNGTEFIAISDDYAFSTSPPPLPPGTDLQIVITDGPDPAIAGQQLAFTITVTNNGPWDATGVVATDTIPAGLTFKSADTHGKGTYHDGVWSLGKLIMGATAALTLVVTVDVPAIDGAVLRNAVQVSGQQFDPNTDNNAATQDTIVSAPNMKLTMTDHLAKDADGDGVASPGDTIGYTAIITNVGSTAATGVRFSDTPDASTTLVAGSVTTTQGAVVSSPGAREVEVSLGQIPSQRMAQITFRVTVNSPLYAVTRIANQGLITGSNIFSARSDDPGTAQLDDPTATPIRSPRCPRSFPYVFLWVGLALATVLGAIAVWLIGRRKRRRPFPDQPPPPTAPRP